MQVNLVTNSLNSSKSMMAHKQSVPAVKQVQTQNVDPNFSSIYFGSNDKNNGMKKMAMGVLIPLSILTAAPVVSSCEKDQEEDSGNAYAYAYANASASASALYTDSTHRGRDTVFVTNWDTCFVDTGSYHHDIDTIYQWKDRYERPLPLDTLTKHMVIFGVDDADSVVNRNIVHYEYTREWEYNNRVIANMNILESDMNKNVLVHDVEVKDYKGNHKYYGKEVRRMPDAPVVLKNKNGSEVITKNGIFLEVRRNNDDNKNASYFDTELENRYFLQTAGDSVKVYQLEGGNRYVEKGRMAKGYLGDNTILWKNGIGSYSTDDHLVDVKVVGVSDDTLKEMYARARDDD